MYDFIDLNSHDITDDTWLSPEAVTVDGVTLDQAIPEFTTLQVTGRELVGYNVTTVTVGNQDGSMLQKKRREERKITVKYQIDAETPQRFREIYYKLNQILSGENKKVSFADDPDKYFVGTLTSADTSEGGYLSVISSFEFTCFDPYSYANKEDVFTFGDQTTTQQISVDMADKVAGKTSPVPHAIYKGHVLGDGAIEPPGYYTQELTQLEYGCLGSLNGRCASSAAKSEYDNSLGNFQLYANESGGLDSIKIEDDKLNIKGWHVDNSSTWRKYAYIIVTDEDSRNHEYSRLRVTLTARPDIQKTHSNIAGSGMCGFEGELPWTNDMANKRLRVRLRYTNDAAGNGNYCDWSTIVRPQNLWRYQVPHFVAKLNITGAIEQAQPGFFAKYGIAGDVERLNWVKNNVSSANVKIWGYGSNGFYTQAYKPATGWADAVKHTQSKSAMLELDYQTSDDLFSYVDGSGNLYMDIYGKSSTGETDICLDYIQLTMLIATPVTNSLNVVNEGTQPVPVRFELTNHGENGYIGISNNNTSYLLGNPDEVDGKTTVKSKWIAQRDDNPDHGLKQWTINAGVLNDWNANPLQQGAFEDPAKIRERRWRLRNAQGGVTAWGTGQDSTGTTKGWHGPSASMTFPTDSNIKNFTAHFYTQFLFGNMSMHGLQQFNIWDVNRNLLVSIQLWKWINCHASLKIRVGDHWILTDENNAKWDNFFGQINVQRIGNTYTITLESIEGSNRNKQVISYTDTVSGAKLAGGMTYWKAIFQDNAPKGMWNDLYDFWIRKDNAETYTNIPNVLKEGDKLVITGDNGKVTTKLNGGSALKYQDIGSRPIMANPGNNHITFSYSNFANRPDVTAYIRRKYL